MKAPDDQAVIGDKLLLRGKHRVVLRLEHSERVAMTVEGRLMSDDEVVAARRGAFQHVERRHHRYSNSANAGVWIA